MNDTEKSPEEIKTILRATAGLFLTTKLITKCNGEEVPDGIGELMDEYLSVVEVVLAAVDMMDKQLTIEKADNDGGKS